MWIELSIGEYYNRSRLCPNCMSDPLRTDAPQAMEGASAPDRDAKIEQLLLAGLDHYFGARYDQAIAVWSRALFLDRNHARARAYIDRARSALAERQRESEELLQNGLAAFHRGQGDEARRLLQAAMNMGAPPDEALAVLDRLSRLAPGPVPPTPSVLARVERSPLPSLQPVAGGQRRLGLVVSIVVIAAVAIGAAVLAGADPEGWPSLVGLGPEVLRTPAVAATVDGPLPIPLRGETAFARAQTLVAGGHLHDALAALDRVRPTDPQRGDADRLRADIQRQLIGLAATELAAPPGGGSLP
jgi:tetratricopeptide (TPR) repeat protein